MSSNESAIAELMAVEKAWVQAHVDLDLAVLEGIMADEYLAVEQGGELLDKKQTLASYASGQRHWDVAVGSDYIVHVYDHTAVVIGRWRGVGMSAGETFDYWARFISVYVKSERGWQMVSAQSTPIEV